MSTKFNHVGFITISTNTFGTDFSIFSAIVNMGKMNTKFNAVTEMEFKADLEQVIDSKGFMYIVNCLKEIAEGKADHLIENWQDKEHAREYLRLANKLDRFYYLLDKSGFNI